MQFYLVSIGCLIEYDDNVSLEYFIELLITA